MSSTMPILRTEALCLNYGSFAAVKDVNLIVEPGTIHSVIGPNGAGKTSLFHCLTGNRRASAGSVIFEERDITRDAAHTRIAAGMGRSFQITSLFQNLSTRENLRLAAQGRQMIKALCFWSPVESMPQHGELADEILDRIGLRARANDKAGELSHGQQRLLEVGMALAARPRLLLLDEPTSGMGVDDIPTMTRLITDLAKDHTVLLIEHNMGIVMAISDTVSSMHQGQLLVQGPPDKVRKDPLVREAYLGEAV
jgi:branched-chain amino acid transport system ATP-binding protein